MRSYGRDRTASRAPSLRPFRRFGLALLCVAIHTSGVSAQEQIEIQRLAQGVYAAIQPTANRFDDANSLIVVLADGVLIVDTQVSPGGAASVLAAVRTVTDLPVRWVVNTHWHGDHVQGNQLYRSEFPDAEFIAHATTGEDIEERARGAHAEDLQSIPEWLARAKAALESGVASGETLNEQQRTELRGRIERREAYLARVRSVTEFVTPTRTFEDTLTLAGGRVRLRHLAGHTRGDVIVHLPDARIVATGDLLDDLPFTGHGSPRDLVATLDSIAALGASTFVPGHGRVRVGSDHLERVRVLFESILTQVQDAAGSGLDLQETQARVNVEQHRDYFVTDDVAARYWAFFIPEAVRRAWEEMRVSG